jgi:hypothetical protein
MLFAAVGIGAIVWDIITWLMALPTSSSHAIISGYAGAAIAKVGFRAILVKGTGTDHSGASSYLLYLYHLRCRLKSHTNDLRTLCFEILTRRPMDREAQAKRDLISFLESAEFGRYHTIFSIWCDDPM